MSITPLISVIIPIYNGEKYLTEAVQSIQKQPIKDLEIILVNDGSKDNSLEICKSFSRKYSNVHTLNQTNSGVSIARNLGLDNAQGKYIAFLDADDVWCKNFYDQDLYDFLLNSQEDLIAFDMIIASHDFQCGKKMQLKCHAKNFSKMDYLKHNMYFSTYLYKRSTISNVRFTPGLKYNEDIEFIYNSFIYSSQVTKIDKYIMIYRMNPNSFMHTSVDNSKLSLETVSLWEKNLIQCQSNTSTTSNEKKELMSFCLSRQITFAYLFINQSAKEGKTNEEILALLSNKMSIDRLKNIDDLYLYDDIRQIHSEYWQNPNAFVNKYKKNRFIHAIKHVFKKSKFIRSLLAKRQKTLFTDEIQSYVIS